MGVAKLCRWPAVKASTTPSVLSCGARAPQPDRLVSMQYADLMWLHSRYMFHHVGGQAGKVRSKGRFSTIPSMCTSHGGGEFRVQWQRLPTTSTLAPLARQQAHIAFRVPDLAAAIEGEDIVIGPCEPIKGYCMAVVNDAGVLIELIQTAMSDEELWRRGIQQRDSPRDASPVAGVDAVPRRSD